MIQLSRAAFDLRRHFLSTAQIEHFTDYAESLLPEDLRIVRQLIQRQIEIGRNYVREQIAQLDDLLHPHDVALRDGMQVEIRPVEADDIPAIKAMHTRLSPQSIYMRYFSRFRELSDELARRMCCIDYQDCMTMIAVEPHSGDVIGIASYVRHVDQVEAAEVGVLVEDTYQRRGLGTRLLRHLAIYAHANGIRTFTAFVSTENQPMRHMIKQSGMEHTIKYKDGAWEIHILLDEALINQAVA